MTPSSGTGDPQATPDKRPQLTEEKIRATINGARVRGVPNEGNSSETINWTFVTNEPKEISILEKQVEDERAVVVVNIKTRTVPGARNPRELSGKLRLHYKFRTGWVLRRWEIASVENISMKYKGEPKKEDRGENIQGVK